MRWLNPTAVTRPRPALLVAACACLGLASSVFAQAGSGLAAPDGVGSSAPKGVVPKDDEP